MTFLFSISARQFGKNSQLDNDTSVFSASQDDSGKILRFGTHTMYLSDEFYTLKFNLYPKNIQKYGVYVDFIQKRW